MLVCGSREHQLLEIYEKFEKRGWSWYTIIQRYSIFTRKDNKKNKSVGSSGKIKNIVDKHQQQREQSKRGKILIDTESEYKFKQNEDRNINNEDGCNNNNNNKACPKRGDCQF